MPQRWEHIFINASPHALLTRCRNVAGLVSGVPEHPDSMIPHKPFTFLFKQTESIYRLTAFLTFKHLFWRPNKSLQLHATKDVWEGEVGIQVTCVRFSLTSVLKIIRNNTLEECSGALIGPPTISAHRNIDSKRYKATVCAEGKRKWNPSFDFPVNGLVTRRSYPVTTES